jgi:hypothetical protein
MLCCIAHVPGFTQEVVGTSILAIQVQRLGQHVHIVVCVLMSRRSAPPHTRLHTQRTQHTTIQKQQLICKEDGRCEAAMSNSHLDLMSQTLSSTVSHDATNTTTTTTTTTRMKWKSEGKD